VTRGKRLRILVTDQSDWIGAGSSRGLQGWFHSGALYARPSHVASRNQCERSGRLLTSAYGVEPDGADCSWLGGPLDFLLDRPDEPEWQRLVDDVASRGERVHTQIARDFVQVRTGDRVLYTTRVLKDLTASSVLHGAAFELGMRLCEAASDLDVGSLVFHRSNGTVRRIHAKHVIVTTGAAAQDPNCASTQLTRRSGVILSATPSLDAPLFVRIAKDPDANVSHLVHTIGNRTLSAMGDSTSLPHHPTPAECVRVAHRIAEKVRATIGSDAFRGRRLAWHASPKAEIAIDNEEGRVFAPALYDVGERSLAIVPSKFSLFPLVAELASERFDGVLDRLPAGSPQASHRPPPPIAPMLSAETLGLAPSIGSTNPLQGELQISTAVTRVRSPRRQARVSV